MQVRSVGEVAARPEVGVAERLEVRDLRRAEARLLGRRESEEELRAVGDQLGTLDACGERHLLRQPGPALQAAPDEALADARHAEQVARGRRTAPSRPLRCARASRCEARRRDRSPRAASCPGRWETGSRPRAPVRARPARPSPAGPRAGASPPGPERSARSRAAPRRRSRRGRSGVGSKRSSSRRSACSSSSPGFPELGRALAHTQGRGDDLVVERRHQHLDAVVANDPNAVEQVLLRSQRAGSPTRSAVP